MAGTSLIAVVLGFMLLSAAFAEEAKTEDPFGVSKQIVKENEASIGLTGDEKDFIAEWMKAVRNKNTAPLSAKKKSVMDEIRKRFLNGAGSWSAEDFNKRMSLVAEMRTIDKYAVENLGLYDALSSAVRAYIPNTDDPAEFARRMSAADKSDLLRGDDWRSVVSIFLDRGKFAKTTAAQKYEFVHGWLLARVPADGLKSVRAYADELKKEATGK